MSNKKPSNVRPEILTRMLESVHSFILSKTSVVNDTWIGHAQIWAFVHTIGGQWYMNRVLEDLLKTDVIVEKKEGQQRFFRSNI